MRQITVDLRVGGMSCASCVVSLEAILGQVPRVQQVSVNLATERVTVSFDADITGIQFLVNAVEETGYRVRSETVMLPIRSITCTACINTIERGLASSPGVLSAHVNLATRCGLVTYLSAMVDTKSAFNKLCWVDRPE
jgi:P-type Cu+ transporter